MSKDLKNSIKNTKNGRYVLGGTTEVSLHAIEWWDKTEMERHPSDIVYIMEKKYESRPDMLGYVFYGDPGLWWLICQYNGILDPIEELVEGRTLLIPLADRIKRDIQNRSMNGGSQSTRQTK